MTLFILIEIFICLLVIGCQKKDNTHTNQLEPTGAISDDQEQLVGKAWWKPKLGLSWQWQLTGKLDLSYQVDVIDVDMDVHSSVVDHYHQQGSKVICYVNVGSYEDWRKDADLFASEVIGKDYQGWAGERWLDIRRIDLLAPIMRARFDLCAQKGFDAIEPDNMEVPAGESGFYISSEDRLRYAIWLADEAHARGLAIGVKNSPDLARELVDVYDFAITEDCFYYGWYEEMTVFIDAGKAVFAAEYTDLTQNLDGVCELSKRIGFSTILKNRNLNAWIKSCD